MVLLIGPTVKVVARIGWPDDEPSRHCPRPVLPVPDRNPACRPDPYRPVQLGLRPPPRWVAGVPHRGHRQRAGLRGVLRRAARCAALAGTDLGRGSRGRWAVRAVPPKRTRRDLHRRRASPAAGGGGPLIVF